MDELSIGTLLLSSVAGGLIGFLSGVFGIGGAFLLVPLLSSLLGIPLPVAVGSTTCYTLGPATTALLARRPSPGFFELPMILAGGLFAGVYVGTSSLTALQSMGQAEFLGRPVAAVDLAVMSCYAVLITSIAFASLGSAVRATVRPRSDSDDPSAPAEPPRGLITRWNVPPLARIPDLTPSVYSIPLLAAMGFGVGCLSGFLGMSGGLLLVPATVYLLGQRVQDAATLTVIIVWIVSCQASVLHALNDRVHLGLTVALLATGPPGARLGAEFGMRLPGRQLRLGFGIVVLAAAGIVWARLWSLLTAG